MKLKEEVFEAARAASIKALKGSIYAYDSEWLGWRAALEAAADHLQKPLEMPTDKECTEAAVTIAAKTVKGYENLAATILTNFVQRRNAPPVPPPDWRREPICQGVIAAYRNSWRAFPGGPYEEFLTTYTDAIIAALDAAEKEKG